MRVAPVPRTEIEHNMRKLAIIIGVFGFTVGSFGLATFGPVFNKTYDVNDGSPLKKAQCSVCHAGAKGGKLNAYGQDLQKAMASAKSKKLTAEILKSVEGLDSNKDGVKNGDAIKAGKLP